MLRSKLCYRIVIAVLSVLSVYLSPVSPVQAQMADNLPCSTRQTKDGCFAECTNENFLFQCRCIWVAPQDGICPPGQICCHNMPCEKNSEDFNCLRGGGSTDGLTPKNCSWSVNEENIGTCSCTPPLVHSRYSLVDFIVFNPQIQYLPPFDCTCPFTTDEQWLRLGVCNPPTVRKLEVKLNFVKPLNDSVSFEGSLSIPENFVVEGATLNANIGGVIKTFTLDARGKGRSNNDQAQLTVKTSHGAVRAQQAKLSLKFNKGTFGALLADDGLLNQTVTNTLVSLPIEIEMAGKMFAKTQALKYSAKAGKSGSAK